MFQLITMMELCLQFMKQVPDDKNSSLAVLTLNNAILRAKAMYTAKKEMLPIHEEKMLEFLDFVQLMEDEYPSLTEVKNIKELLSLYADAEVCKSFIVEQVNSKL
jgi:hypothetical protein